MFASAARNRTLLRVGVAFTAFVGALMGVWVALLVYAYGDGGGATAASVMALVQLVPSALFATHLGSLADRHRPGRVLFWAYGVLALSLAAVAVLIEVGAPRWSVFALAPVVNLAVCVPRPAQAVLLPSVVTSPHELAAANAGEGWLESAGTLAAPLGVAVLLNVGGAGAAVSGMVILAVVSMLCVATIPGPAPYSPGSDSRLDAPQESGGLRLLVGNSAALTLMAVLGGQNILVGALDLIFVVLAFGELGMGQGGAGYLTAAFGAGGLLAITITGLMVGGRRQAHVLIAAGLAGPVALLLLAGYTSVASAIILFTLAGLGRGVCDVTGRTLLQRTAPPQLLAQVFGMLEALACAGLAIGAIIVPLLVGLGGATGALVGTALVVIAIIALFTPRLRAVDASANVPIVELRLLRSIPLFAALPAPSLETLAASLTPEHVPAGTVVIREGDTADRYYAIARGELDVLKHGTVVATRSRAEGVGEIALIRNSPRTSTVIARTDADLYALEREPFLFALTGHTTTRTTADTIVDQRLDELATASDQPVTALPGPDGATGT